MKEFLLNYWQLLLAGCLALLSVIVGLIRKKPITNVLAQVVANLLEVLPSLIVSAEGSGAEGSIKLQAVIQAALSLCQQWLGRKLTADETSYLSSLIENAVESILTTPTKK